jgi:hypothetical protein
MTLAVCLGFFWLYRILVVPRIEPPTMAAKDLPADLPPPLSPDDEHQRWFREGDWERGPCSILLTSHGKILFDDYQIIDSQTWLVFPFSMVLQRETDGAADVPLPPLVLRSEKGARLRFSQPVAAQVGGSNFELQTAQLEGRVELYRRALGGHADDLRVETSNIQLDHQQIQTIDDVFFRLGDHQGMGRHMTIQLSHTEPGNNSLRKLDRVNGISKIRIGFLSSMRLLPRQTPMERRSAELFSPHDAPIEISTAGPFEFDFQTNRARFQKQVQVRKLDAWGDTLASDELVLQFLAADGPEALGLTAVADKKFELQTITAAGDSVLLLAPSQRARIVAQELHYDIAHQYLRATSGERVELTRDIFQFAAPSLSYYLTADQSLGKLLAQGPGHLIRNDPKSPFRAAWGKSLSINRVAESQHAIQLDGDVELKLAENSLNATRVDLSVWEVPVFDQQQSFARWSYQPESLTATGQVHVSAEKLIADTNRLTVRWPANPLAVPQELQAIDRLQSSTRSPEASLQRVCRVSYLQLEEPPPIAPQPIQARSNSLDVTVADENGNTRITDLSLAGNVRVIRPNRFDPALEDIEVLGETLWLTPLANEMSRMEVRSRDGEYATVRTDHLKLNGGQIFVDQSNNQVRVHGAGVAQFYRGSAMAKSQIASVDAVGISPHDDWTIEFGGGMVFDGQQVYFEQEVNVKLQQVERDHVSITSATGAALNMRLERKLMLTSAEEDDSRDPPQIVEMIFLGELPAEMVQFKPIRQTTPEMVCRITTRKVQRNGSLIEQVSLSSRRATLDQLQNRLLADGPGFVEIHRRSENGKLAPGFGFVGYRPTDSANAQLTYVRVNFQDQLIANTRTDEIVATGNLRSLYAAVDTPDQSFDPDRPGQLPDGAVRLNCQRIDLLREKNPLSPRPQSQFIASGNAHIRSQTIDSTAERITYRDDTDELTLGSASGEDVVLRMRRDANAGWDEIVGSELVYRLRDQTAHGKNIRISATIGNRP